MPPRTLAFSALGAACRRIVNGGRERGRQREPCRAILGSGHVGINVNALQMRHDVLEHGFYASAVVELPGDDNVDKARRWIRHRAAWDARPNAQPKVGAGGGGGRARAALRIGMPCVPKEMPALTSSRRSRSAVPPPTSCAQLTGIRKRFGDGASARRAPQNVALARLKEIKGAHPPLTT